MKTLRLQKAFAFLFLLLSHFSYAENSSTLTKEIALKPIIKTFKKEFAKQLNKRECERKIFVKKAKLSVKEQSLVIDFTARITRGYCTRRARTQVFEKTKAISFYYSLTIDNGVVSLNETSNNPKQHSFERSLTDVIGSNSKKKIAEILSNILQINNTDIEKNKQTNYQSVIITPEKISLDYTINSK